MSEIEMIPASEETCRVVDSLINALTKQADGFVKNDYLDHAHNRIILIDEMLGFKAGRCKGGRPP